MGRVRRRDRLPPKASKFCACATLVTLQEGLMPIAPTRTSQQTPCSHACVPHAQTETHIHTYCVAHDEHAHNTPNTHNTETHTHTRRDTDTYTHIHTPAQTHTTERHPGTQVDASHTEIHPSFLQRKTE